EGRHGFGRSRSPGVGKGGPPLSGFLSTLGLIDDAGLFEQELPLLLLLLAFEFLPALVHPIAQFVKNAALLDHRGARHPGDCLSSLATAVWDHRLEPALRSHAPLPQPMHKRVPCGWTLSISHLPIHNLPSATAIRPEAKCDQQHPFLSRFLL